MPIRYIGLGLGLGLISKSFQYLGLRPRTPFCCELRSLIPPGARIMDTIGDLAPKLANPYPYNIMVERAPS